MKNYRKKPVVIQAIQWDGRNTPEVANFMQVELITKNPLGKVEIETLEGTMNASKNDWIIKGVNGEFYPCKPDIFEKTYDLADAPESFLDRVIKEKAELAEKTSKLKDFIENNPKFDELTNINRILLINQFNAMELYLYALDSRIEFIND